MEKKYGCFHVLADKNHLLKRAAYRHFDNVEIHIFPIPFFKLLESLLKEFQFHIYKDIIGTEILSNHYP